MDFREKHELGVAISKAVASATASHTTPLAVAQNAAANGRLFVGILALANFANGYPAGVALCAVPIGLAYLAGTMPRGASYLARASVITSVGLFVSTLLLAW